MAEEVRKDYKMSVILMQIIVSKILLKEVEDYWSEGVQRRRDKLVLDLVATFTRPTSGTSSTLKGSCNLSLLKSF